MHPLGAFLVPYLARSATGAGNAIVTVDGHVVHHSSAARFEPSEALTLIELLHDPRFAGDDVIVVPDLVEDDRFTSHDRPDGVRFVSMLRPGTQSGIALIVWDRQPLRLEAAAVEQLQRLALALVSTPMAPSVPSFESMMIELLEVSFEHSQVGTQLASTDGTYLWVNSAFADLLGRSRDEIVGRQWGEFMLAGDVERRQRVLAAISRGEIDRHREQVTYVHGDRTHRWGDLSLTELRFAEGIGPLHLIQVIDVSDQVALLDQLRAAGDAAASSERRFRSLVEPSPDVIMRYSVDGTLVDTNAVGLSLLGADSLEPVTGAPIQDLLPPAFAGKLLDLVRTTAATRSTEVAWREWIVSDHRAPAWYVVRAVPVLGEHDHVEHVFVVMSDVTELVESEQRLALMALTDPLTGCANRAAVLDRLSHALERLHRTTSGNGVAVVSVDLDHFKAVNDTFGHPAGDASLRAVADSMRSTVRVGDTVGRIGGDEFLIVLEDVTSAAEADHLGERIRRSIRMTSVPDVSDPAVRLRASIGVEWTPGTTAMTDLVAAADRSMYEAKRRGRNRVWSANRSRQPSTVPGASLRRDLQTALAKDEWQLHYQPIVDVRDHRIAAVEALLRWNHPTGLRAPDVFLEALIESGQIGAVGQWCLARAIQDSVAMHAEPHLDAVTVHVNLTPAELSQPVTVAAIRGPLEQMSVEPSTIAIEVTEQAFGGAIVSTSELDELRGTGVALILDDFGTGTSSLSHLRTKQLHGIKIDRSFVSGGAGTLERRIARAVIDLTAAIGISVVAEGVETAEQSTWLLDAGCHLQQGWLFAAAMPIEELLRWRLPDVPATE